MQFPYDSRKACQEHPRLKEHSKCTPAPTATRVRGTWVSATTTAGITIVSIKVVLFPGVYFVQRFVVALKVEIRALAVDASLCEYGLHAVLGL